jgi:hypothetical protein
MRFLPKKFLKKLRFSQTNAMIRFLQKLAVPSLSKTTKQFFAKNI